METTETKLVRSLVNQADELLFLGSVPVVVYYIMELQLNEQTLFMGIMVMMWLEYLWTFYLKLRQRRLYASCTTVPLEMEHVMQQSDFTKARLYAYDKSSYSLISELYQMALSTAILWYGFLPWLWQYCSDIMMKYGYNSQDYEIMCSSLFTFLGAVISTIMSIPWDLYFTFVLEQKHGFNKQTAGFYIKDQIKKFIVSQALSLLVMAILIYIIKSAGDYFFIYCYVFVLLFSLVMITIYPDYIAPLFDKFEPLKDGELKTKIEELAESLDFPLKKLYVVEGSKRSAHSNAYFYGFFKNKRIVLYDTLLQGYKPETPEPEDTEAETSNPEETKAVEKVVEADSAEAELAGDGDKEAEGVPKKGCTDDEVVAVLAHELGHWYHNHVLKNFAISQVNVLLMFFGLEYFLHFDLLYTAFGFHDVKPVIIGFYVIFSFIYTPYNLVVGFLMTVWSRSLEFQADLFAMERGKAELLRSSLIKLNVDNLSFPIVDWLYSAWNYSHPPIMDRLEALKKEQ